MRIVLRERGKRKVEAYQLPHLTIVIPISNFNERHPFRRIVIVVDEVGHNIYQCASKQRRFDRISQTQSVLVGCENIFRLFHTDVIGTVRSSGRDLAGFDPRVIDSFYVKSYIIVGGRRRQRRGNVGTYAPRQEFGDLISISSTRSRGSFIELVPNATHMQDCVTDASANFEKVQPMSRRLSIW